MGARGYLYKVSRTLKTIPYNTMHCRKAHMILKSLAPEKGKLPNRLRKLCDDYASEVLGWKGYSPWLYVYTLIFGEFKKGWIPNNYYTDIVIPLLKGQYGRLSSMRSLVTKIFGNEFFPDVLYFVNGKFLSSELEIIPEREVKERLFEEQSRVVFKEDSSLRGLGVHVFEPGGFDIGKVKRLGNGVFQGFIDQYEQFDRIVTGPVSTIRITTVYGIDGRIEARGSFLRVGREGESHVRSSSQTKISIDPETGKLAAEGYNSDWKSVGKHPDTGFVFGRTVISGFEKCKDTVIQLHKRIPQVASIGWDIAIDRAGGSGPWSGTAAITASILLRLQMDPCSLDWDGNISGGKGSFSMKGANHELLGCSERTVLFLEAAGKIPQVPRF